MPRGPQGALQGIIRLLTQCSLSPYGHIGDAVALLHMRARPNLMTQTLDDMGGLVASRLHDRMQAYAGVCVCATLRDMGGLVASRLHDRMQACAGMQACACDGLSGDPGGMVLMSF